MDGGQPKRSYRLYLLILAGLILVTAGTVLWLLVRRPAVTPTPTAQTTSPVKLQLALFASGLSNPTAIVASDMDRDERLFVLDQSGKIRIVNRSGTVVSEPFLDNSSQVNFNGEMGLLGMAFSPHYATDGYFYVDYVDKGMNTVVARYHVSSDANTADSSSAQIILKQPQPYTNHNGGQLAFGPDGYLYIGLGDGGSANDPQNHAQDLGSWLGKILRIDVNTLPFTSPSDNPFTGRSGAKAEIWDFGLRNPWRFSFDIQTHDLYIADVGQGSVEEIDAETPSKGGHNYGWRCYEGGKDFNGDGCKDKNQYVFPTFTYDHSEGRCAVAGGYVYRGRAYPDLSGKYFYADYCGGQLYWLEKQTNTWASSKAIQTPYKISTFGQDNSGELYAADYATGAIYQLQDAP